MHRFRIQGLSKTYKNGTKALRNVNLDIGNGIFGLLGPNGAGKSTLMRMMATLQKADQGALVFNGENIQKDPDSFKRSIGYLPQEFGLYPKITALELLDHLAILKGITVKKERKNIVELVLHKTNLFDARKKNLGSYSGGMKRRFGIAQALLNKPHVLIVDEPTAGLDPGERNRFHKILSEVSAESIVILSTHIVEDVEELCNQVAIMHEGQILKQGHPKELVQEIEDKVYVVRKDSWKPETEEENFRVISEKLKHGVPYLHIYKDQANFRKSEKAKASLEDAYFFHISQSLAK